MNVSNAFYEHRLRDRQSVRSAVAPGRRGTKTNRGLIPRRRWKIDRKRSLDASVHRFLSCASQVRKGKEGPNARTIQEVVASTCSAFLDDLSNALSDSSKATSNTSFFSSSRTLINALKMTVRRLLSALPATVKRDARALNTVVGNAINVGMNREHCRLQDLTHTRIRNQGIDIFFSRPEKPRLTDMTPRRAWRAVPELFPG